MTFATAGLYLHVPFCQSRCVYCDFYSTTCGPAERGRYVEALCRELEARADEVPGRRFDKLCGECYAVVASAILLRKNVGTTGRNHS